MMGIQYLNSILGVTFVSATIYNRGNFANNISVEQRRKERRHAKRTRKVIRDVFKHGAYEAMKMAELEELDDTRLTDTLAGDLGFHSEGSKAGNRGAMGRMLDVAIIPKGGVPSCGPWKSIQQWSGADVALRRLL
jgi:hypothetical protein